jgi:hypothetical protein
MVICNDIAKEGDAAAGNVTPLSSERPFHEATRFGIERKIRPVRSRRCVRDQPYGVAVVDRAGGENVCAKAAAVD